MSLDDWLEKLSDEEIEQLAIEDIWNAAIASLTDGICVIMEISPEQQVYVRFSRDTALPVGVPMLFGMLPAVMLPDLSTGEQFVRH